MNNSMYTTIPPELEEDDFLEGVIPEELYLSDEDLERVYQEVFQ